MSEWYEGISPPCPHCGDEITDSALTDIPFDGVAEIECGGCGSPVTVERMAVVKFRAALAQLAEPTEVDG